MGNFKLSDKVGVKKDTSVVGIRFHYIKEAIVTEIEGNEILISVTESPLNDVWFTFTKEKFYTRMTSVWVNCDHLLPLEEKYIDPLIYI